MTPRGRAAVGVVATAVVVGAVVGGVVAMGGGSAAETDRAVAQLSVVAVQQRDLTAYTEWTATLGFTQTVTVSSPGAGTVTGVLTSGARVEAGTVVATLDGAPAVALIGDVPGWRDLDEDSDDGVDVRQLETNLVALGYDPDGAIQIDETFDGDTADAVERWETALGLDDPDGVVAAEQVVFVPGDLLVGDVAATLGASVADGGPLFTGRVTARTFVVPAVVGDGGTVDHLAATGTPVASGTVLFWSGGIPVVAVEGDVAALPALRRDLAVGEDDGADVKVLERMLVAAGFDPDGAVVVDDGFDEATAAAVVRLWQSVGAVADGAAIDPDDVVVPAGSLVTVPTGLLVGDPVVAEGTVLAGDGPAMVLTRPARQVMFGAEVGDGDFSLGAVVDVVFPDDTVLPGTVTSVGDVATAGTNGGRATRPVEVSVAGDLPATTADLAEVPVSLRVVDEQTPDALVVPTTALLALAEGGYALEVVDGLAADGTQVTHLVGVEVGQFTDGMVAVTGAEVAAGLQVVVPS